MNWSIFFFAAAAVAIFLGAALVIVSTGSRSSRLELRLREVAPASEPATEESVDAQPPAALDLLHGIARSLGLGRDDEVAQRLAMIGYNSPYAEDLYYAAKVGGPALAAVLAGTLLQHDPLFVFFTLGSISFFLPDLWLSSRVSHWREAIRLSLPDALDLLVITMEAGLGLDHALLRVAGEIGGIHPELCAEFTRINLEQRAGKRRIDAWQNMADRTDLDIIRAFVNMLLQTERFGTPIATSLGNFAESLRLRRRQQAEELAARTTIKLVFPLVLFIFPSMFIVMLAPAIISIVEGLGTQFQ